MVKYFFFYLVICENLSTDRQEDAHEFLCYLIESMERNCLSVSGHADELYVAVFKNNFVSY